MNENKLLKTLKLAAFNTAESISGIRKTKNLKKYSLHSFLFDWFLYPLILAIISIDILTKRISVILFK